MPRALHDRRLSAALGVAAFCISVIGSWIPSLWADEGATISAVTRPLGSLWPLVRHIDAVHVAYYVTVHPWVAITGPAAFWLRLPSAIAVGACAFVLHRLGLRMISPAAALYATLAFAILPRVTWMGIEGRSSAFSSLVALLLTYVIVRWSQSPSVGILTVYGSLVALGVALHVYLLLLLPLHVLYVVITRGRWLRWTGAAVGGVVVVSPLVVLASRQTGQVGGNFEPSLLRGLRQIAINQFFLGESPLDSGDPLRDLWQPGAVGMAVLSLLLVASCAWIALRKGRGKGGLIPIGVLTLGWAFIPGLIVLAISLAFGHNLYHPRYFAFCAAAMALLVGWAIGELAQRWQRVLVLVLLVGLAFPVYISQRQVNAKTGADWSEVVAFLQANARPGDGIYYSFTNRIIGIAYPGQLDHLNDITLLRDSVTDNSLAGESRPLAEALDNDPPETIWAIYRLDWDQREHDEQLFANAGYRPFTRWNGTWDEVVGYRRE